MKKHKYILFFETDEHYEVGNQYRHVISMLESFNKKMSLGFFKLELYEMPMEIKPFESKG